MKNLGFEEQPGLPQFFVKRDESGGIMLIIAKVVDDILVGGSNESIDWFCNAISKLFEVSRIVREDTLILNSLRIQRQPGGTHTFDIIEYIEKIDPIAITRERRKDMEEICTNAEKTRYLKIAGELNFLGHGTFPQAAFVERYLLQ